MTLACLKCSAPITVHSRTGMCRTCAAKAAKARNYDPNRMKTREMRQAKRPCETEGCPNLIGFRAEEGRCRSCQGKVYLNNPEVQKKAVAGLRRFLADPANRKAHAERSQAVLGVWREQNQELVTTIAMANLEKTREPEAQAKRSHSIRRNAHKGVPEHRWDDVVALTREVGAVEARRLVIEDERVQEKRKLAGMTALERQLYRLEKGGKVVEKVTVRKPDYAYTLGGVTGDIG